MIDPKELYEFMPFAMTLANNKADAEDILHNAYLKLSQCKYDERGAFSAMVRVVIKNCYIDMYRLRRKWWRNRNVYFINLVHDVYQPDYEQKDLTERQIRRVAKVLHFLSPEQRFVFDSQLEGYCFQDIADLMGISVNTALGHARYAREKIKKALDPNLSADEITMMEARMAWRRRRLR